LKKLFLMSDQFLYETFIPLIFLLIIAFLLAEFIGRSKHIGWRYTFLLSLSIIPGIIALIFSPSATEKPKKGNNFQRFFGIILILGGVAFFIKSFENPNLITFVMLFSQIVTGRYLIEFADGKIYNNSPKFYFSSSKINSPIENKHSIDSALFNLNDLKQKGILSDEEYKSKIGKIESEKAEQDLKNSTEYKQLKNLLDSGILTRQEFDNKISLLKKSILKKNDFRIIDGFSEGIGLAINSELDYGFVDENGKIVIDFIFEHAENFKNDTAKVRYNGEFRIIDKKGNFI
jgi:hypothetical protein